MSFSEDVKVRVPEFKDELERAEWRNELRLTMLDALPGLNDTSLQTLQHVARLMYLVDTNPINRDCHLKVSVELVIDE